jgi:DNA (cytosine-5)-methyltransferase 1
MTAQAPSTVDPLVPTPRRLTAVDLFCGAGGLTEGLHQAGFSVIGAVELAPLAAEAYRSNHPDVHLWRRDIRWLQPHKVLERLDIAKGALDLLAGCPPCQGFSTMRTHRKQSSVVDDRNVLVSQFGRFAEALLPKTLMMENVPGLEDDILFTRLCRRLERLGYALRVGVLDASDYGVPQRRRRLVLLGSRVGPVVFAPPSAARATVKDALVDLLPAGQSEDPLHDHGERRSDAIRTLIKLIPLDGGSRTALAPDQQLACHRRQSGWFDVYGRMAWDQPSPTITSGCVNPSKGRFLHPTEHRSITLREAALLQGFHGRYRFPLSRGKYRAADLIGNALPPGFVAAHARQLARVLHAADASP